MCSKRAVTLFALGICVTGIILLEIIGASVAEKECSCSSLLISTGISVIAVLVLAILVPVLKCCCLDWSTVLKILAVVVVIVQCIAAYVCCSTRFQAGASGVAGLWIISLILLETSPRASE